MKNGTYAIRNILTGALEYPQAGEARPCEIDLRENEEIMVWDVTLKDGEGDFVHIEPEPTRQEVILADIRAFLEAIDEKIEDLEAL